jgi:hypothetical protein
VGGCGLKVSGSGYGQMTVSRERGNEHPGSTRSVNFLD